MEDDSQCTMNWPLAIAVSVVIHVVGLGLFVMCSDNPSDDEAEAPQAAAETQGEIKNGESSAESSESEPGDDSPAPASTPTPAAANTAGASSPSPAAPGRAPEPNRPTRRDDAPRAAASVDTVVYTVQRGDHLTKISKRFKCTITEIAKLNNIKPNSGLRIGQKLKIPAPAE